MAANKQFNIKNGLTVGLDKKLVIDQLGAVSATELKVDNFVTSDLIPVEDLTLNLGVDDKRWNTIYVQDVSASGEVLWSEGGSISANSVYTTVSTNSAEWFHVGATGTYDDFTGGFNYEKIVYVQDTTYTFPTTPRGHAVFHIFPDYDRPRIVALKTQDGFTQGEYYIVNNIDTGNNNLNVTDLEGNESGINGFIEFYKRGDLYETVNAIVYSHDTEYELPTTAKNDSALHVFDTNERPRIIALSTNSGLTKGTYYYIDKVDPPTLNVHVIELDGTVVGWIESTNKRGNPLVWEVVSAHDVNQDSDYYNIGEAVRHNIDEHDHGVTTTVRDNSASWETAPTIHSMTRSILQVITPYGNTGELIDWTPQHVTTNLSGWWDASDESTITTHDGTHGGNITTWTDKSDSIAAAAQNTPITSSTLQNGLSTIEFEPNELFKVQNYKMPTSGNVQIFIVCDASVVDNVYDSIISYNSSSGNKDFQLQSKENAPASNFKGVLNVEGIGDANVVKTPEPSTAATGMNMYCITFDWSDKIFNFRINTAKQGTDYIYANKISPTGELKIFSNRAGNHHPGGTVAEVIITDDITTNTRVLLEGYLAHKWGITSTLQSVHPYKNTPPKYSVQDYLPEFLSMQSDNTAGDSTWPTVNYEHAMVVPYDATVSRVVLRGAATQGANVNVSVHSNRDETDPNSVEFKFFPITPIEIVNQTYVTNNEGRVFTFSDTTSAAVGRTLGISISADRVIGHTNATIVLEYDHE